MITEHKVNFYIGTITGIVDNVTEKPKPSGKPYDILLKEHKSQEHIAIVTIPGVAEYIKVYPGRNQVDEPKIEDLVVVAVWDPIYLSYCTYEKLKENDFVGFRAHGKMVDITHDKITVGVFDESTEYKDKNRPDVSPLAQVDLTKEGEIYVHAAKDITVDADSNVTINVKGSTKLVCPDVTITGNGTGKVTIAGNAKPNPATGGWCAIPNCLLTNAPHRSDKLEMT